MEFLRVESSVLPNEGEVYTCIHLYLVFIIILMIMMMMIIIIIIVDYRLWIMNVLGFLFSLSGSMNRLGSFGKYACVCMGMCR